MREKRRFLHLLNGAFWCGETLWSVCVKRRFFLLLRMRFEPFGTMNQKLQFFPAALNGLV